MFARRRWLAVVALTMIAVCVPLPPRRVTAAPPSTPDGAADAVIQALASEDVAKIRGLARSAEGPDPWLVVEALFAKGAARAVDVFVSHVDVKMIGALDAWVASRPNDMASSTAWAELQLARQALDAGNAAEVLERTAKIKAGANEVVAISALWLRARALPPAQSADALALMESVGKRALALKWYTRASRAWDVLGERNFHARNMAAAIQAWMPLLQIARIRGVDAELGNALNRLGMAEQKSGALESSRKYLEQALVYAEKLGSTPTVAHSLCNLAITLRRMGAPQQALPLFERALRIRVAEGNEAEQAKIHSDLGGVLLQLGAMSRSIASYERAIVLNTRGERIGALARSRMALAAAYTRIGKSDAALRLIRLVEPVYKKHASRLHRASLAVSIAAAESEVENQVGAARVLREAAQEFSRPDEKFVWAVITSSLGAAERDLGEMDAAQQHLEAAARVFRELNRDRQLAHTLITQARIQHHRSQFDDAIKTLNEALVRADAVGAAAFSQYAIMQLASVYYSKRDFERVIALSKDGVKRAAFGLAGHADEHAGAARGTVGDLYSLGAAASMGAGSIDDLNFFIEAGRGAAFIESLGGRAALSWVPMPESLRQREQAAHLARERASQALAQAVRSKDRARAKEANERLASATREAEAAQAAIERESKAVGMVMYPHPEPIATLQAALDPGDALVSYLLMGDESVALVVTKKSARSVALATEDSISDAIRALRVVGSPDTSKSFGSLRTLLVEPLKLSGDVQRVLISPDRSIAFVPFSALMQDKLVCFVPSGSAYTHMLSIKRAQGQRVLAVGDPDYASSSNGATRGRLTSLPATRAEAKAVGDVVLLGDDATPTKFLDAVGKQARWSSIHLACHGFLDAEDAFGSSLVMTSEPANGGHLSVRDIMRAHLPSDLAVLSACNSGRGKAYAGEGAFGLVRAFLIAGTSRVVASLWRVDDEATAALMKAFYRYRSGGMSTAGSLAKAQADVRAHPKWAAPRFWAAWVLWGLPQ